MLIATGGQNWARFNAMLVANSILLAIVGPIVIERKLATLPWYGAVTLPLAGLVLCLVWGAAVSRGAQYQNFYVEVAREIEGGWVTPKVRVLVRGGRYAEKCMRGLGKLTARRAMNVVIWVFAALHLGGLVFLVVYRQAGP